MNGWVDMQRESIAIGCLVISERGGIHLFMHRGGKRDLDAKRKGEYNENSLIKKTTFFTT